MLILATRLLLTAIIVIVGYFALQKVWTKPIDIVAIFKKPSDVIPVRDAKTADRPWVSVATIDLITLEAGKPILVFLTIGNTGQAIANNLTASTSINVTYTNPGADESAKGYQEDYKPNPQPRYISLPPGRDNIIKIATLDPTSAKHVAEIRSGKVMIYVIGEITYEHKYSTKFFAHYDAKAKHFVPESTFNEAN